MLADTTVVATDAKNDLGEADASMYVDVATSHNLSTVRTRQTAILLAAPVY